MSTLLSSTGLKGIRILVPRATMYKLLLIAFGNELIHKLKRGLEPSAVQQYAEKLGCFQTENGDYICNIAWRGADGNLVMNFSILEPLLMYLFITFGFAVQHSEELAKYYADEARRLYKETLQQLSTRPGRINIREVEKMRQIVKEAISSGEGEVNNIIEEIESMNNNGQVPNVEELAQHPTIRERIRNLGNRIISKLRTMFKRG